MLTRDSRDVHLSMSPKSSPYVTEAAPGTDFTVPPDNNIPLALRHVDERRQRKLLRDSYVFLHYTK